MAARAVISAAENPCREFWVASSAMLNLTLHRRWLLLGSAVAAGAAAWIAARRA